MSYSEPNRGGSDQRHGLVPVGGKIAAGHTIEIQFRWGPEWYCSPDPNVPIHYGFFNYSWPYALPEPMDAAGHRMLLVDPDGKVAEAIETNNTFQFARTNPYQGIIQGSGAPDLKVTKIEVQKVPSAYGQYIDVYIKNVGTKTAYSCGPKYSNSVQYGGLEIAHGYVDGSDRYLERGWSSGSALMTRRTRPGEPYVLQPGEERMLPSSWFLQDENKNQYGTSNGGLPPGCHELKILLDPQAQIPNEIGCNNTTYFYFASGNATCDPSKVMRISPCLQIAPQPLIR